MIDEINTAEKKMIAAYGHLRTGQMNEAEVSFRVILSDPDIKKLEQPVIDGVALSGLALVYMRNYDYEKLESLEIQLLALCSNEQATSFNVIKTLTKLARLRRYQGRYEKSRRLILKALLQCKVSELQLSAVEKIIAYEEFAQLLWTCRRYKRAAIIYKWCLDVLEAANLRRTVQGISVLHGLACAAAKQDCKSLEAKSLWEECVDICQETAARPKIYASILSSLANLELNLGNVDTAVSLFEESILMTDMSGIENTGGFAQLALIYKEQRKTQKFFTLCDRLLSKIEASQSLHELEDPRNVNSIFRIGVYFFEANDYEKAAALLNYARMLVIKDKFLDNDLKKLVHTKYDECLKRKSNTA